VANDARGPATWPSWAFPWTEGAATSTLGTSRWIAQASSSVMDTLLPVPRRTPPKVTVPARTIIRFEPRLWSVRLRPFDERTLRAFAFERPLVDSGAVRSRRLAGERELCSMSRAEVLSLYKDFVEAGGLLAYGASLPAVYRRAAYYVDRILKGTKPRDLPIEQPTKFDLVINMKTAKTLGLTIPVDPAAGRSCH